MASQFSIKSCVSVNPPVNRNLNRRVWRVWSVAAGADVTWGLLGEMARLLNVSSADLESRDTLRWSMPAKGREQLAQRQLETMGRLSKSLGDLTAFRAAGQWVLNERAKDRTGRAAIDDCVH